MCEKYGMTHMTYQDILTATGGVLHGSSFVISSVSIDTRTIDHGALYVPIRGANFDGHQFVEEAFSKGAAAAIVDSNPEAYAVFGSVILVESTERILWALAQFNRARLQAKVIAITGSSGKTSTKEMLWRVLEKQSKTFANSRSLNNHWGLPLTLANCPIDADFAILEMGMNSMGEISPMSKLAKPDIAYINNIMSAHVGRLGSLENIARAKVEIFDGLSSEGTAIIHGDSPFQDILRTAAQSFKLKTFGAMAGNDMCRVSECTVDGKASVVACIDGRNISYDLSVSGAHYVTNSLGVLLICHVLGYDLSVVAQDLKYFTPVSGRGNCLDIAWADDTITIVDESYNATPDAVKASLSRMGDMSCRGRRVFVLGDMLELGSASIMAHKNLLPAIQDSGVDVFFGCGEDTRHLFESLENTKQGFYAPKADKLAPHVVSALKPGDLVMIKGSFSMGMKKIVTAIMKARGAT